MSKDLFNLIKELRFEKTSPVFETLLWCICYGVLNAHDGEDILHHFCCAIILSIELCTLSGILSLNHYLAKHRIRRSFFCVVPITSKHWTQKPSFVAIVERSCDAMPSRCMVSRHRRSVSKMSLPVFRISKEHEGRRILSPTCNVSSTIHCQEKITTARSICLQIYQQKVACTRTFLSASSELADLEDRIAFGLFSKTDMP